MAAVRAVETQRADALAHDPWAAALEVTMTAHKAALAILSPCFDVQ